MSSSLVSANTTSLRYCSCLNVRVTLTCPTTEPTEDPIHPSFQWCWLSTSQGVHIEHNSLTLRHHWDENWVALHCLNCNLDVYAYDTTDSLDSSEPLRPILFNKTLKSEPEAESIRNSETSSTSLEDEMYSPAFKVIITSTTKASSLNPISSTNSYSISEFQKQLDLLMESYLKRQETAMQLRIEEFREEQQRLLESSISAARFASSRLFQVAQTNQSSSSEARNPFGSSSPESLSALKDMTLDDSSVVEPSQKFDLQEDDSDAEDFAEGAQEVPSKQTSQSSDNMGYLSSSFNEDMFDLDEDYSRSISSAPIQELPPASLRSDIDVNNGFVGSFAAQGRYFPNAAPKFVPDSPSLSSHNGGMELDRPHLSTNIDLSDMLFSSSLPITIQPRSQNSCPIKLKPDQSAAFEAPHELASRTYANDKDQLFGGVPRSVTHRLGI